MSFRPHQTWHEWVESPFYLDSPIADDLIAIGATTSGRQQMAPLPRILQHIALVKDGVAHLRAHHGSSHPQCLIEQQVPAVGFASSDITA